MITIQKTSPDILKKLVVFIEKIFSDGIEDALRLPEAVRLRDMFQGVLDDSGLSPNDQIFVRLGATSAKDSFALDAPTTKPSPMNLDADIILRSLLTSSRCVGRILSLSEGSWSNDPGEAIIIQK